MSNPETRRDREERFIESKDRFDTQTVAKSRSIHMHLYYTAAPKNSNLLPA
jgi:hypothetical protein